MGFLPIRWWRRVKKVFFLRKTRFSIPSYGVFIILDPTRRGGAQNAKKGPKKGGKKWVLVWTNGEGVCRFWRTGGGTLLTPLPHPKNPIRPRLIEKQKTPFFRVFRPLFGPFWPLFGSPKSPINQRFAKIDDYNPRLRRFFVIYTYV